MPFVIILGIIAFLLMEHAIAFWLVFIPLAIIFLVCLYQFFMGGRSGIGYFVTAMISLVAMVIALMVVCIPS